MQRPAHRAALLLAHVEDEPSKPRVFISSSRRPATWCRCVSVSSSVGDRWRGSSWSPGSSSSAASVPWNSRACWRSTSATARRGSPAIDTSGSIHGEPSIATCVAIGPRQLEHLEEAGRAAREERHRLRALGVEAVDERLPRALDVRARGHERGVVQPAPSTIRRAASSAELISLRRASDVAKVAGSRSK